jgi:hypothetical protein
VLGLTVIDMRDGADTVTPVDPETLPEVAVIVAPPTDNALASPPAAMPNTDGMFELQAADAVRSCVLPSLNVPVAVYCCVVPLAIVAFAGVTEIDTRVDCPTVNCPDPETAPTLAEIVAVPLPALVTSPALPTPFPTTPTPLVDEFQVAISVTS